MKAQELYDLRQRKGFCDGAALHEFFDGQIGDPSPKGRVEIDDAAAQAFVGQCEAEIAKHAPSKAKARK